MRAAPALTPTTDTLAIRPWPDPVIDSLGHDPRSDYVERFWLGVLGPSTTWLLRRLAAGLEAEPAGFELPLGETARALGLGGEGRNSPFVRALTRCCQFELANPEGDAVLAVRRKVPPLNRRQLARLPEGLQAEHQRWQDDELTTSPAENLKRRANQLALSLLELGEDTDTAERQLLRWRFHPSLTREAVAWAFDAHAVALADAARHPEPGIAPIPRAAPLPAPPDPPTAA